MESDRITRQIQIDANQERVWNAISDASIFGTWFCVALDGPFIVGEKTTGKMTYPGHEDVAWHSITELIDPPRQLVFRWPHLAPGVEIDDNTIWLKVSFVLESQGDGTLLTVTETGFAALPEDQRVSMLRDNSEGWDIQTQNVKRYVEN